MIKRQIGSTGLETTVLGFGAMELAHLDYQEAEKLLNLTLDQGIQFIDSSPCYGNCGRIRRQGDRASPPGVCAGDQMRLQCGRAWLLCLGAGPYLDGRANVSKHRPQLAAFENRLY